MHQTTGIRDPAARFRLPDVDDRGERRQANRAVAVSAVGLAITGLFELALALLSGSVALLSDALHNLSDVSTSLLVFIGFRASRKAPTDRYPYGCERAEDLAGVGIAVVIWASAAVAGAESIAKLLRHGSTHYVGWAIAGALVGIAGNQLVARYKLRVGRRINSATLIADAKHSWLDALSSAGTLAGLLGVLAGLRWADAVAGLLVTGFICHVGWEVSSDIAHRLMDGIDPSSPPPKPSPPRYPASATPTPAAGGPAAPCASTSKAGSTPTPPSPPPTASDKTSLTDSASDYQTCATSPGLPAASNTHNPGAVFRGWIFLAPSRVR
jgi:cation diffusion facilitator family transporter